MARGHETVDDEALAALGFKLDLDVEIFDLFPENVPAVEAFIKTATQWRRSEMSGVLLGLDYSGVRAAFDLLGIDRAVFNDLQLLEREYMRAASG